MMKKRDNKIETLRDQRKDPKDRDCTKGAPNLKMSRLDTTQETVKANIHGVGLCTLYN